MADDSSKLNIEESARELIEKFGSLGKARASLDESSQADRDFEVDEAMLDAFRKFQEAQSHQIEKLGLENDRLREDLKDQEANREMRFKYSTWVFGYLVGYSVFVAVLLLLAGTNNSGFTLPEEVLKFLVGSTAAAAIGLVAAVTTGLFNKK